MEYDPRSERPATSRTEEKVIAFFDVNSIVHVEFLTQGKTINQHIYRDVLRHLMQSVQEKRQQTYEKKSWLLHHNNALTQNALSIWEFGAKNNVAVLE